MSQDRPKPSPAKVSDPMIKPLFTSLALTFLVLTVGLGATTFADDFPDIRGKWAGTYKVAFPAGHATHANKALDTMMVLDVYKQEGNLIWVTNKWRRAGTESWITEYGTGSFDMEDPDELVISEEGPAPQEGVNTGGFIGEYDDGNLYLNYFGPGMGVSFSVELKREGG